ncbi:hypothetical protein FA95DRAFT_1682591 [Auriscalpium vulgare]|uniref:Uncharacterized protein n=1 Tax=Auriscalpium vulgare TaxID=40419 RepID=A0ACB8RDX7_9AGAM|nr:hypothetical protein FA95DRAFT_1682591 [Auriscalpium vulgare]
MGNAKAIQTHNKISPYSRRLRVADSSNDDDEILARTCSSGTDLKLPSCILKSPLRACRPKSFSIVFSILSLISQPLPKWSTPLKLKIDLGWLTVTHVCRRWRNIALDEPILWASDVAVPTQLGSHDHWAAAFLSRAQDVPLTITLCRGLPSDIAFLAANLARTRVINLLIRTNALALCIPAPLLQTLSVSICTVGTQFFCPPDALFGGAAGLPELRHLSVVAWDLQSWQPLLLAQLVSVDITILVPDIPGPVVAEIFAALGRMRGLEQLVLQLQLKDADGVPVISLPALKCLTLLGGVRDALLLLARLVLPSGVRVCCDVDWIMDSAEISTVFPAMMARIDARPAPIPIARVAIRRAVSERTYSITDIFAEVSAWRSGDPDATPALVVRCAEGGEVATALGSISSTHLEALAMGGCVRDAAWIDALKSVPRLHHVTVRSSAVPPFCAALERAPGIVPALATLVINVQTQPLAHTFLTTALPRCLAARTRAGNVLQELGVVGYVQDEACVCALREAVPGLAIRWSREEEPDELDDESDF